MVLVVVDLVVGRPAAGDLFIGRAAERFVVRQYVDNPSAPTAEAFHDAISSLARTQTEPVRRVAIIETPLSVDELIRRLREP